MKVGKGAKNETVSFLVSQRLICFKSIRTCTRSPIACFIMSFRPCDALMVPKNTSKNSFFLFSLFLPEQSVKDLKAVQDGPPPGGFPSIRYGRRIPSTGPTGATIAAIVLGMMGYGIYKVIEAKRAERRHDADMDRMRHSIMPYLQAEQDRRSVRPFLINKYPISLSTGVRSRQAGSIPYVLCPSKYTRSDCFVPALTRPSGTSVCWT